MTKQLYEEALADVKKLKEVAEDNAKRALLEAVTPRIRDLIENQLLGELGMDELEADPDKLLMDEVPEEDYLNPSVAAVSAPPIVPGADTPPVQTPLGGSDCGCDDEMNDFTVDTAVDTESPFYEVHNKFAKKINSIGRQIKNSLNASTLIKESKGYESLISKLISEVEDTYSSLQNNMQESDEKSSYESVLENQYSTLKQLMEQKMKKTQKTLSEADLTLKLTGLPDEIEDALENVGVDLVMNDESDEGEEGGEEVGDDLDLGGEEGEGDSGEDEGLDFGDEEDSDESEDKMESRRLSDDTIVEIDEGMLRREISRMKALREENETKAQSWGHGPGDVSDEFAEDEMDPFDVKLTTEADADNMNELDELDELDQAWSEGEETKVDEYAMVEDNVDEMDEMDEMDEAMHELEQSSDSRKHHGNVAKPETGAGAAKSDQNRMPNESLRRRIAAEMKLQLEAKKKASKAKKLHKEQQAKEKQAKKDADKKAAKKKAKDLGEAYNFYARKFNESVARTNKLKGMLAEATRKGSTLNGGTTKSAAETDLRNKLAETNLFNAKLLFTNKLLQNESLTKRQKAEVIERLDEAKNEREVKLVYESLVKTLAGTPAKITESADRGVIGSSSRPARPASATNTLNEGFEADRWARLAGIVK